MVYTPALHAYLRAQAPQFDPGVVRPKSEPPWHRYVLMHEVVAIQLQVLGKSSTLSPNPRAEKVLLEAGTALHAPAPHTAEVGSQGGVYVHPGLKQQAQTRGWLVACTGVSDVDLW